MLHNVGALWIAKTGPCSSLPPLQFYVPVCAGYGHHYDVAAELTVNQRPFMGGRSFCKCLFLNEQTGSFEVPEHGRDK